MRKDRSEALALLKDLGAVNSATLTTSNCFLYSIYVSRLQRSNINAIFT